MDARREVDLDMQNRISPPRWSLSHSCTRRVTVSFIPRSLNECSVFSFEYVLLRDADTRTRARHAFLRMRSRT
ncbi:hypothetical protein C0J52_01798 [Blattella germanica]|nr:hypothetical protein C0J52_01798 [Blattella germanica]